MSDSSSVGVEQKTAESQESVDVPENFAPESQEQTSDETGNSGNIEKGNYDQSEYQEYLKQLEEMQNNPLLAFNNAVTSFAVSLTKPPRSNSSYPGGYYINGYFEGMKIPLPSNLGNLGIITELLIMQTRDSVQSLYAGLWSVNEDVKSNKNVSDKNNGDRFAENVRALNGITNLERSINSLNKSNGDRAIEIVNLVNRASSLESAMVDRTKEITSLGNSNKDRATEIAKLVNRASSLESAMIDRTKEITSLGNSNKDRASETASLANRASSLESAMVDRTKEIGANKNSISSLITQMATRVTEITALQGSNKDRASETASLVNRASSLESAMKDRVNEINALGTWKNVQIAWNTKQELDNSAQQKAIDANAGSIAGIKTVNDDQQKAIDKINGQVNGKNLGDTVINLNDLVEETGNYYVTNVTNSYDDNSKWFLIQVTRYGSGAVTQVIYKDYNDLNNLVGYFRVRNADGRTWFSWKKVASQIDIDNAKNQAINDSKNYTNQEVAKVKSVNDNQTGILNNLVADMKNRVDEINALGTWKNVQLAWNLKQETDNSNQQKSIDANVFTISGMSKSIDNNAKAISNNAVAINQTSKNVADHETRISKLEGVDWSSLFDTASIVHAVDVVRDKVVLNTSQIKSFGDLNLQYLNDFKILLDKLYKGFSDYPDGFFWDNLHKHLAIASVLFDNKFQEGIDQLDGTLVLILKGINSIGDGINTVSGWLKLIYNKPSQIFQTNESGTNFWDVLKQAISTLGDLLNGTLGNAVKALDSILDFLDSFLDKIIELFIPKNTNFMSEKLKGASLKFNVKFGSVLSLSDNIKNAFTPAKADFMSAISFEFMGAKFAPDRKIFDMYVPKVRAVMALMIWLEVAWYIFKRLTGSGDLINDN